MNKKESLISNSEEIKQQQPSTPDSGTKSKREAVKEWKFIGFDKNQSAPYAKPIEGHVKTRKLHTKRGEEFTTYRFHLDTKKKESSKPKSLHLMNNSSCSNSSNSNSSNSPSISPVEYQIDSASSYPESTVQTPTIIHSLDTQVSFDFSLLPDDSSEQEDLSTNKPSSSKQK